MVACRWLRVSVNPHLLSGLAITAAALTTTEAGAQDTFTFRLDSRPTLPVTVQLTSEDAGEVSVGPTSITFQPSDWNVPRTVTVTGHDDALVDGDQLVGILLQTVSSDASYNSLVSRVNVTHIANDIPGMRLGPGGICLGSGGTARRLVKHAVCIGATASELC